MAYTFTAVYQKATEGGYIGFVEELPGANTQGETLEEVRENLQEGLHSFWKTIEFLPKKPFLVRKQFVNRFF